MLLKGSKSSQSYDFYTLDIDLNLCCGFFIQNGKSFTTFNQGRKKKKKNYHIISQLISLGWSRK